MTYFKALFRNYPERNEENHRDRSPGSRSPYRGLNPIGPDTELPSGRPVGHIAQLRYCLFITADDDNIDDNVVIITLAVVPLTYTGRYFHGNLRL